MYDTSLHINEKFVINMLYFSVIQQYLKGNILKADEYLDKVEGDIMNIYFVYLGFALMHVRISDGEINKQIQRLHDYHHEGIVTHIGKRYNNGYVLTCVLTLGIQMCIDVCIKTSGCGFVNFDTRELHCNLITAGNGVNTASLVSSQWSIFCICGKQQQSKFDLTFEINMSTMHRTVWLFDDINYFVGKRF